MESNLIKGFIRIGGIKKTNIIKYENIGIEIVKNVYDDKVKVNKDNKRKVKKDKRISIK